mgnify:CR=1 FL=1
MALIVSWDDHESRGFWVLITYNVTQKQLVMGINLYLSLFPLFPCN